MPSTLEAKVRAEHRLRELLRCNGLPQPDAVEYGFTCVRFYYDEPKTCVIVDLEEDADEEA